MRIGLKHISCIASCLGAPSVYASEFQQFELAPGGIHGIVPASYQPNPKRDRIGDRHFFDETGNVDLRIWRHQRQGDPASALRARIADIRDEGMHIYNATPRRTGYGFTAQRGALVLWEERHDFTDCDGRDFSISVRFWYLQDGAQQIEPMLPHLSQSLTAPEC